MFCVMQYGFRAGDFTETALHHEFELRIEHCLVRKKRHFQWHVAALQGLGMSKIFTTMIDTSRQIYLSLNNVTVIIQL